MTKPLYHDWGCPQCLCCLRCGVTMREVFDRPWLPTLWRVRCRPRRRDHTHAPDEVPEAYVPEWAVPVEPRACP